MDTFSGKTFQSAFRAVCVTPLAFMLSSSPLVSLSRSTRQLLVVVLRCSLSQPNNMITGSGASSTDRLLISEFLIDKNYLARTPQAYDVNRQMVLTTFASLVLEKISAAGMHHTVSEFKEAMMGVNTAASSFGLFPLPVRYWYSKAKHYELFEEAFMDLDDVLADAGAAASSHCGSNVFWNMKVRGVFPSEQIWWKCCKEKFVGGSPSSVLEVFRDIGSDEMARAAAAAASSSSDVAAVHAAKLEVALRRRDEGAYRVFREMYMKEMWKREIAGLVGKEDDVAPALTWGELVELALKEYNLRRERKATEAAAKAASKAAKAAAKAKAKAAAGRRSRSPRRR